MRCRWPSLLPVLFCCFVSAVARAQNTACAKLPAAQVPESDWPTPAEVHAAGARVNLLDASKPVDPSPSKPDEPGCSGLYLYYGHGPNRFTRARACVFNELGLVRDGRTAAGSGTAVRLAQQNDNLRESEGLVLAMLYANGEGVRTNLPLARQMVCQYGSGIAGPNPDDVLASFNATTEKGLRYDVCHGSSEVGGRATEYDCRGLDQAQMQETVARQQARILAGGSAESKAAFRALLAAWTSLHNAFGDLEGALCAGGTGCGVESESDDVTILQLWSDNLKSVEQGTAPAASTSAASFSLVDGELNDQYRRALQQAAVDGVDPEVRTAERAWLRYRDAWVRFGTLRWPNTTADQWRAWATDQWRPLLAD